MWHLVNVPDSPDTPAIVGSGWDPVVDGNAQILLAEPRRMRDRAADLIAGVGGPHAARNSSR